MLEEAIFWDRGSSEMWSVQLETTNGRFLDQEEIYLHLRCKNDAIFP